MLVSQEDSLQIAAYVWALGAHIVAKISNVDLVRRQFDDAGQQFDNAVCLSE